MFDIEYVKPSESDTKDNIILHNLHKSNETKNKKLIVASCMAWLKFNSDKTLYDLELKLRELKLDCYLIAKMVHKDLIPKLFTYAEIKMKPIDLFGFKNNGAGLMNECTFFIGSIKEAENIILKLWKVLSNHVNELDKSGIIIENHFSEKDTKIIGPIINAECKINIKQLLDIDECKKILRENIKRDHGEYPKETICSYNNLPLMLFTIKDISVCHYGFINKNNSWYMMRLNS